MINHEPSEFQLRMGLTHQDGGRGEADEDRTTIFDYRRLR